jgi:hypothetical protein
MSSSAKDTPPVHGSSLVPSLDIVRDLQTHPVVLLDRIVDTAKRIALVPEAPLVRMQCIEFHYHHLERVGYAFFTLWRDGGGNAWSWTRLKKEWAKTLKNPNDIKAAAIDGSAGRLRWLLKRDPVTWHRAKVTSRITMSDLQLIQQHVFRHGPLDQTTRECLMNTLDQPHSRSDIVNLLAPPPPMGVVTRSFVQGPPPTENDASNEKPGGDGPDRTPTSPRLSRDELSLANNPLSILAAAIHLPSLCPQQPARWTCSPLVPSTRPSPPTLASVLADPLAPPHNSIFNLSIVNAPDLKRSFRVQRAPTPPPTPSFLSGLKRTREGFSPAWARETAPQLVGCSFEEFKQRLAQLNAYEDVRGLVNVASLETRLDNQKFSFSKR